jgi:hypothetical protein
VRTHLRLVPSPTSDLIVPSAAMASNADMEDNAPAKFEHISLARDEPHLTPLQTWEVRTTGAALIETDGPVPVHSVATWAYDVDPVGKRWKVEVILGKDRGHTVLENHWHPSDSPIRRATLEGQLRLLHELMHWTFVDRT